MNERTVTTDDGNDPHSLTAENEKLRIENQQLQQKILEIEETCSQLRARNSFLEEKVAALEKLIENNELPSKETQGDLTYASLNEKSNIYEPQIDAKSLNLFHEIITHLQTEYQELIDQAKKDQAEINLHIKFGRGIDSHQLVSHSQNINKRMENLQRITAYTEDLRAWSQSINEKTMQNRDDLLSYLGSEKPLIQSLTDGKLSGEISSEGTMKTLEEKYSALKKEVEFYRDKFFVWEYLSTAQKEKNEKQVSELLLNLKAIGEVVLRKDDFTYLFLGNSDEFLMLTMKRIMECMLNTLQGNRSLLQKLTEEKEEYKRDLAEQIGKLRDAELKIINLENELRILQIEHGNLKKSTAAMGKSSTFPKNK